LKLASFGIADCTVNTFCPVRGPKAMRYVHTAACSGLSARPPALAPDFVLKVARDGGAR